jgi:tetrahydromethanopterin S-methyltransferase subunit G
LGLTLLIAGFNAAFAIIIKFNDFSHMEKKLDNIEKKIDMLDKKTDDNGERVAKIEGTCSARKDCK